MSVSPGAVAILLPGGAALLDALGAVRTTPLGPVGTALHHLPLVQRVVQPVVDGLQQQEDGSDHPAVDAHDHHGGRQGLERMKKKMRRR